MMRIVKILAVILLCIGLVSCTGESYHCLLVCGSYAVPGIFYSDMKGPETDCRIIETDSFGRVLFEFIAPCFITGKTENVLVICQKADSDYVYFYEDICFSFADNNEFSVSALKEINDWNKELNIDKMAKRPILISFDGFIIINDVIAYSDVLTLCRKRLGFSDIDIRELCIDDVDAQGNEIFYIKLHDNNAAEYFLFVSTDLDYDLFEISDFPLYDIKSFSKFKEMNGWQQS